MLFMASALLQILHDAQTGYFSQPMYIKHITQVDTSHDIYAYLVGDGEDLPWPAEGETQRRWGIDLLLANRFQTRKVVLS